jgi:hypothetical protein
MVRKYLATQNELVYERPVQPEPKLGEFKARLTDCLEADAKFPRHQRRTAQHLFEGLMNEGY